MWHGWTGWGDWIWMTVGMVAFWGLLIALVLWAVRRTSDRGPLGRPRNAPEILEERFARGEIDQDEFEERREALSSPRKAAGDWGS